MEVLAPLPVREQDPACAVVMEQLAAKRAVSTPGKTQAARGSYMPLATLDARVLPEYFSRPMLRSLQVVGIVTTVATALAFAAGSPAATSRVATPDSCGLVTGSPWTLTLKSPGGVLNGSKYYVSVKQPWRLLARQSTANSTTVFPLKMRENPLTLL